ncbi:MAG: hypothetical protein OXI79_00655 [Gammaproteobacteria bacterium]|nr:hypothetical protein [Gammaproteobacteria bacterium]
MPWSSVRAMRRFGLWCCVVPARACVLVMNLNGMGELPSEFSSVLDHAANHAGLQSV